MSLTFQELILNLSKYWSDYGCIIQQPYDIEKGASTMNPATFLRALGPEPYSTAMVEPCRRPTDARYGENPNRLGHYFQYQVILKPSPDNAQGIYLKSLEAMGIDLEKHDVRFVEDNWESPTLGAALKLSPLLLKLHTDLKELPCIFKTLIPFLMLCGIKN